MVAAVCLGRVGAVWAREVSLRPQQHLGNTGRKTGFWLEELAAPYYVFEDAGAPLSPKSPINGTR